MKASSSPPSAGAKYLPYFVAPSSTLRIVAELMLVAYLRSRSRLTFISFVIVVPAERCVVFSAANAVVVANAAAENTVIADNVVAITFVLMLFFFIVISPFVVFGVFFVFVFPLTVIIVYQVLYNRITTKNNSF